MKEQRLAGIDAFNGNPASGDEVVDEGRDETDALGLLPPFRSYATSTKVMVLAPSFGIRGSWMYQSSGGSTSISITGIHCRIRLL